MSPMGVALRTEPEIIGFRSSDKRKTSAKSPVLVGVTQHVATSCKRLTDKYVNENLKKTKNHDACYDPNATHHKLLSSNLSFHMIAIFLLDECCLFSEVLIES